MDRCSPVRFGSQCDAMRYGWIFRCGVLRFCAAVFAAVMQILPLSLPVSVSSLAKRVCVHLKMHKIWPKIAVH